MKLAEIITDAKTGEVTFVLTNTMTCQNDNCNMPASDTVKGLTGREVTKLMEKIQKL